MNWCVSDDKFIEENIAHNGNKYLIGNGYFGVRGTLEEYTKENMPSVNLAGIYDRVGDAWRESINAPNPLYAVVYCDGIKYTLPENSAYEHEQRLDFRNAVHHRKTVWKTDKGSICVECERFASMANNHLLGMKYTVSADYDCTLKLITGIDGDVWDINGPHLKETETSVCGGKKIVSAKTNEQRIRITTEENTKLLFDADRTVVSHTKSAFEEISWSAKANEKYSFERVAAVHTSVDDIKYTDDVEGTSYEEQLHLHKAAWDSIWDISEIVIDGDERAMHAINYSIYHLNCIAPRGLKGKSIPARGLSGQVYKGAVFWDTEMFMMDYYIHTEPEVAKTLIEYRIDTLNGAKIKASEYGLDGAYYAWESQEGGYEACSDFNVTDVFTNRPMRTHFRDKQYHVSAAVVYGIMKYINATGDTALLDNGAREVIVECAKMYRSLLLKRADSDMYEIYDVVGPDEYHERVNNNVYTNRMAKFVFETAAKIAEDEKLREVFKASAEKIKINIPDENGVIEQFDGYFKLEDVSVDEVRSRLLDKREYWGGAYGVASGTQVIKQADVVAMLSIFNKDYDIDIMQKNLDYYEPRTEHGSSLSACMYSLLSCQVGDSEYAYPLFLKSAEADLRTGGKEWAGLIYIGGTHPASEGGAWIVAVKGFAGIDISGGKLECKPNLPKNWNSMTFKLIYKNELYRIDITQDKYKITKL